jgi:hypothetical protein
VLLVYFAGGTNPNRPTVNLTAQSIAGLRFSQLRQAQSRASNCVATSPEAFRSALSDALSHARAISKWSGTLWSALGRPSHTASHEHSASWSRPNRLRLESPPLARCSSGQVRARPCGSSAFGRLPSSRCTRRCPQVSSKGLRRASPERLITVRMIIWGHHL